MATKQMKIIKNYRDEAVVDVRDFWTVSDGFNCYRLGCAVETLIGVKYMAGGADVFKHFI